MSSFSENFQRDENKNTQYDDSAFYIFAMTMLLVGIIIVITVILRRIFHEKKYADPKYHNCQCQSCKTRLDQFNAEIHKKHINFTFYFYLLLLCGLTYLLFKSYNQISQTSGKLKTFDPYEILEIDSGADERTIKKAYKRLALQYHPDKNPNNLQAKTKFMLIAKAYDALTKEESMKNYEKYGNPDGPTPFRISVALPSFILEKKNHMPILILFVLFILIILPVSFLMWISKSNQYDDSGVMVSDNFIFYQYLNENSLLRQMPFVMGLAQEYSSLKINHDESDALGNMYKKNLDLMSKHKLETIPPPNKKAICILYSYINNTPMAYPLYTHDLIKVLKPTSLFIDSMYKMAINCTQIHNLGRRDVKQFGYNCIRTIFDFSQNLHQRISHVNSNFAAFMQLPYLTEQKIKLMSKNYRKVFNNKSTVFNDFIQLPIQERRAILSVEYGDEEIDDIEKAIAAIPIYDVKIETFVEGFEDILVDDLVTYKFTIERRNLKEGEELGVNHSCYYPSLFDEQVSICILVEKTIVYQTLLNIKKRITTHEYKNPIKDARTYPFTAEVIPLNYKGLDQVIPFEVVCLKTSDKRKEHMNEIAKREVKKIEPSYFQQLLNQVIPIQGDEEDEEEEDDTNKDKDKDKDKDKQEENEPQEEDENDNEGKDKKTKKEEHEKTE